VESGIVMEERLEEFIRKLKNRHYNSKTIETYQNLLKHFISFYNKHIIAGNTVRERDIERFIQYLKNKNLKSKMSSLVKTNLK
jgi:site-specific recombinase XerD